MGFRTLQTIPRMGMATPLVNPRKPNPRPHCRFQHRHNGRRLEADVASNPYLCSNRLRRVGLDSYLQNCTQRRWRRSTSYWISRWPGGLEGDDGRQFAPVGFRGWLCQYLLQRLLHVQIFSGIISVIRFGIFSKLFFFFFHNCHFEIDSCSLLISLPEISWKFEAWYAAGLGWCFCKRFRVDKN